MRTQIRSGAVRCKAVVLALSVVSWTGASFAEPYVYQYDEYSSDLVTAATQITSQQLSIQAGFAQTEAFGQHYKPAAEHYPIRILGIDLVLAMPPNATASQTHADIEIWLDGDLDGASPVADQPAFSINTADLFNTTTAEMGTPLLGGVASAINFDWDDPLGHPPIVYEGGIRVVIRFAEAAQDLQSEWNSLECVYLEGLTCGCQQVGVLFDSALTPKANLLNYLTPMGTCSSSSSAWSYVEDLGISGDIVMRLRADVAAVGGSQQGQTGSDEQDSTDDHDTQAADDTEMEVAAVSPFWGVNDDTTAVTITGSGFDTECEVTLGSTLLEEVEVVGEGLIRAVVPAGMDVGRYMLVVANPGGESAFLVDAFEVMSPEVSDDEVGTSTDSVEEGCAAGLPLLHWMLLGLGLAYHRRMRMVP